MKNVCVVTGGRGMGLEAAKLVGRLGIRIFQPGRFHSGRQADGKLEGRYGLGVDVLCQQLIGDGKEGQDKNRSSSVLPGRYGIRWPDRV